MMCAYYSSLYLAACIWQVNAAARTEQANAAARTLHKQFHGVSSGQRRGPREDEQLQVTFGLSLSLES